MTVTDALALISTILLTETPGGTTQGTAFYYSRLAPKTQPGPEWVEIEEIWLVTNRHVLLPRQRNKEVIPSAVTFHLRKAKDSSETLEWEPVTFRAQELHTLGKFHPDRSVDVAMLDISQAFKSRVREGREKYLTPYLLSSDTFAGNNNIEVETSSDILVVGYPKGFYDEVNLFPIVKAGIVASRWGAGFKGRPYFLIDAKLFPGSSGSVVLSKPIDFVVKDGRILYSKDGQFAFLGVYSGEPFVQEDPVEIGNLVISEKSGFDLGVVWYAELVEEILRKGVALREAITVQP